MKLKTEYWPDERHRARHVIGTVAATMHALNGDCRYTSAAPVVHDPLTDKRRDDARNDER